MPMRTKPWTVSDPPRPAVNWTKEERERCVAAANAALEDGKSEQDAIFACIGAAGKELEEKHMAKIVIVAKVLSHDQIRAAVWEHIEGMRQPTDWEAIQSSNDLSIPKNGIFDDYALVVGGEETFKIPFTIEDDEVVFGDVVEGGMQFVPKGEKAATPSWKCGASRGLSVNETRSWDGSAAKGRIFSWAGWDDNPSSSKARRGFLAYDSANSELRGSYKLPFADIVDGELVALRSGLNAAASRLPQTDIPESVQGTARGVIDGYQAKFEKALADGKEVGVAGTKTAFKIYDKDGETLWIAATSTAFKDREKEIVSRDALDYTIGFSDVTGFRGELNLYHLQHIKLGSCDFQYRVDKVLLEGGKWYDNEYANAVRGWLENVADKEGGEPSGCSIEFFYVEGDKEGGVYHKVIIFNRAVLKREHAANQYTWIGGNPETIRRKEMSTKKDLDDILGEELAEQALADLGAHSKDIEGTGAEYKGDEVEGEADDAGEELVEDAKADDEKPEDKGADAEAAEEADPGEAAPDETEVVEEESTKEVVFSDESIGELADAISKHLGIDDLKESVDHLRSAVTVLAQTDEERLEAKARERKKPKGVVRDSKKGDVPDVKDEDIVEPTEEKSEEDEVAEAREKAYDGYKY